eukprot:400155_1
MGLKNAGKSTFNRIIKEVYTSVYFDDPSVQYLSLDNGLRVTLHEHRGIWKSYFGQMDGIVYIVDAADPDKFDKSRNEFIKILNFNKEWCQGPILILGNKCDKIECIVDKYALSEQFGLIPIQNKYDTVTGYIRINIETYHNLLIPSDIKQLCYYYYTNYQEIKNIKVPIKLKMCSIINKDGFQDEFLWIIHKMQQSYSLGIESYHIIIFFMIFTLVLSFYFGF